jgi:flagellar biosynthesis protein FlhF
MNLQTFKAPTMAECLAEVKRTIGPDAVIMHTRTYVIRKWLGLKRREMVEITAGRARQVRRTPIQPTFREPPPQALPQKQLMEPASNARALLETSVGSGAIMVGLSNDMNKLTTMVSTLMTTVRQQQAPDVPDELVEEFVMLVEHQVDRELALEIVKSIHRTLRPDHLAQREFVREKITDQLEKLLPTTGPIVRSKVSGPHVVALIGPTGVGKTTTIAKLAAKLKLDEKRKVGLITIDTYRIAAIEQLKRYADIIKTPLKVITSPDDLREAIDSMSDCDFILIDTAGRSPKDALKLNELKNFLEAANPDEVHLVLSTTMSRECAEMAVENFSEVRCDKLIFTKLDEARHVGTVLNIVRAVKKSLSYVTTGQDVPADIEVARGRRIAQLIMGSDL